MSTKKIGKVRSFDRDIEIINLVALQLSAKMEKVVTNKEIINALLQHTNGIGEIKAEKIIRTIEHQFNCSD